MTARLVVMMGNLMNPCGIFAAMPLIKRPFRRSRSRWKYNIKLDRREICCEGVGD
jgi:hypothetical protein